MQCFQHLVHIYSCLFLSCVFFHTVLRSPPQCQISCTNYNLFIIIIIILAHQRFWVSTKIKLHQTIRKTSRSSENFIFILPIRKCSVSLCTILSPIALPDQLFLPVLLNCTEQLWQKWPHKCCGLWSVKGNHFEPGERLAKDILPHAFISGWADAPAGFHLDFSQDQADEKLDATGNIIIIIIIHFYGLFIHIQLSREFILLLNTGVRCL